MPSGAVQFNDAAAAAACFTEDAVYVTDTGPVNGREATEKWYSAPDSRRPTEADASRKALRHNRLRHPNPDGDQIAQLALMRYLRDLSS